MSRPSLRCAAIALCLAGSVLCRADEAPSEGAPAAAAADYGPGLALQSSVEQALSKNFTVRIQKFPIEQAKQAEVIANATYLPTVNASAGRSVTQAPGSSSLINPGTHTNTDTTDLSVTQNVITGGTVTAGYGFQRSQVNPSSSLLNPDYSSTVSLTVVQPLLQGAGTEYNRANLESAALGTKIAGLNFKSAVLSVIYNVETAYLNLVSSREQYKVAQDTLKLAKELYDENVIKRRTGVVTDLDVLQAEVGVATAQTALIQDEQAVHNNEDALLQYMGEQAFNRQVGTVTFPDIDETGFSFDRSYKLARENGPNLAVVAATIEQYKLSALRAKRNNLPQLNVNGGVGYSSSSNTEYSAVTQVWNGNGTNWNAGLTLSVPWGMKANKALYRQAMANVESEQAAFDQADQTLVVQVRAAVRAFETNQASLKAATEQAKLAEQQYQLQKAKFDAGLATSYDVLQAQNQLETSRQTEIQAKVNLRIAIADIHFLEGTSLERYKVNLP